MSATVLVDQAPVNLGPLTAVFTPPPACTVAVGQTGGGLLGLGLLGGGLGDVALLGQECNGGNPIDATSCWPPVSAGVAAPTPLGGWGFYSPGLECPAGHAAACTATGGAGGNSQWPVQFKLLDGETAIGCCPSGFACTNINGQTCAMVATSTSVSVATCAGKKLGQVAPLAVPTGSITAFSMFAPMIQINFQSSDKPAPSTSVPPEQTGNSGVIPVPIGAGNAASSSESGPSPTGAPASSESSAAGTSDGTGKDEKPPADATQPGGSDQTDSAASPTGSSELQTQDKANADSGSGGGLPKAAMMGIFIGSGVAALLGIGTTLIYCLRKRRREREERELDTMYGLGKLDSKTGLSRADEFPGFSYRGAAEMPGDMSRARNF